jgi:hypothetical protein
LCGTPDYNHFELRSINETAPKARNEKAWGSAPGSADKRQSSEGAKYFVRPVDVALFSAGNPQIDFLGRCPRLLHFAPYGACKTNRLVEKNNFANLAIRNPKSEIRNLNGHS